MKFFKIKKLVTIILIIIFIVMLVNNYKKLLKPLFPIRYEKEIKLYSLKYDVDYKLVAAIIKVESKYNKNAKSHKDAIGLMQIIPSTGQWVSDIIGIEEFDTNMLYDVDINIKIGSWYFKYLLNNFNETETALAAYNAGFGNVSNWLKNKKYSSNGQTLDVIPFKETNTYVKKVGFYYFIYDKLYE